MGIQVCFQGHWYRRDGTEECRLRADVREPVLPEERDVLEELPRDACADLDSDRGISDRLIVGRKVRRVLRSRYEERRPNGEVGLELALGKLCGCQQRPAQSDHVKRNRRDRKINRLKLGAATKADGRDGEEHGLRTEVRSEMEDIQSHAKPGKGFKPIPCATADRGGIVPFYIMEHVIERSAWKANDQGDITAGSVGDPPIQVRVPFS